MLGFMWRNLKGDRLRVVVAAIMAFAQVNAAIFNAFPLKWILDKIAPPAGKPPIDPDSSFPFLGSIITFFDNLVKAPIPAGQLHSVTGVILFSATVIIVLGILNALLSYVELKMASSIGQNLTARLRKQLFGHLERLSLDWHGKQKKGDLVQRITGNIADIEKLVTDGLVDLVTSVLTLIGIIAVMLFLSSAYTVIALTIVPALFMITLGYTKSIKAAAKKASKATGQVSDVATEDINALTVIKVFTREEKEALRFGDYVDKNREI